MENKSPYVLIGAAMMVFIAAIVGFVIWKLRAGDQTSYAYYDILFSGEVQGLTKDSPVFYRGLRVGRVQDIGLTSRVDIQRSTGRQRLSEKIEVTVAVASTIDIRERSYAVFEKPFIAGAAFIQIVGRLDVDQIKPKKKLGEKPYPEIREGASFLEATSTSAQELLSKAGTTVDRLNELLSPDNLTTVGDLLKNLQTLSGSFAKQDAAIQGTLAELPAAVSEFKQTFERLNGLSDRLGLIAMELGPQDAQTRKALSGKDKGELAKAVTEAQQAMAKLNGASGQLNKILVDNSGSIRRFTESGLSELGLAVHELRELIVNLNIIATKLERDPAGFVFDSKNGYRPK
jgi:phospholipid/cholesterol/gamma-HCH transport system substrate-binding protein